MIYRVILNNKDSKGNILYKKDIYLSAENKKQLYDRCEDQYRILKQNVEIIEEIPDEEIDRKEKEKRNSR